MIAWLDLAARGEAEVVTSPMTLVEAYDGRTTQKRWDWVHWVHSRLDVAGIGKDEARQARRLLADAKLQRSSEKVSIPLIAPLLSPDGLPPSRGPEPLRVGEQCVVRGRALTA
ncbi:hypothetical protein [Streptomyces atroolivaceus]|uniref:hypothetical protein n=1 Tax=Streptomyces atroolivaceus TaxID=66869 RepID=UPI0034480D87